MAKSMLDPESMWNVLVKFPPDDLLHSDVKSRSAMLDLILRYPMDQDCSLLVRRSVITLAVIDELCNKFRVVNDFSEKSVRLAITATMVGIDKVFAGLVDMSDDDVDKLEDLLMAPSNNCWLTTAVWERVTQSLDDCPLRPWDVFTRVYGTLGRILS